MSNRSIIYTESNNRDGIQLTNPIQQQQQQQPEPPQLVPSMTILPKQKFVLPKEPKTSVSHPINISWIVPSDVLSFLSVTHFPVEYDLYDFLNPSIKEKWLACHQHHLHTSRLKGNLCLSSCPGKKVRLSGPVRGRAAINRDLNLDFDRMKSFGITMIVCCLDDNELDFLGAPWPKYEMAAKAHDITVIRLPMVEGGCPKTLSEVRHAVEAVNVEINKGNNVLAHCRGGVGRAGLFAACWLLENLLCRSVERAVFVLRERRSAKAIETYSQVEYLIRYSMALNHRLGLPFRETTTTDLNQEIPYESEGGTPSIPFIAKLENLILVDPALIQDDYRPRVQPPPSVVLHATETAAATTVTTTSEVYAPRT